MCYLVAKNIDEVGCVALKTTHGKHLSLFKRTIEEKVGYEDIENIKVHVNRNPITLWRKKV